MLKSVIDGFLLVLFFVFWFGFLIQGLICLQVESKKVQICLKKSKNVRERGK